MITYICAPRHAHACWNVAATPSGAHGVRYRCRGKREHVVLGTGHLIHERTGRRAGSGGFSAPPAHAWRLCVLLLEDLQSARAAPRSVIPAPALELKWQLLPPSLLSAHV